MMLHDHYLHSQTSLIQTLVLYCAAMYQCHRLDKLRPLTWLCVYKVCCRYQYLFFCMELKSWLAIGQHRWVFKVARCCWEDREEKPNLKERSELAICFSIVCGVLQWPCSNVLGCFIRTFFYMLAFSVSL